MKFENILEEGERNRRLARPEWRALHRQRRRRAHNIPTLDLTLASYAFSSSLRPAVRAFLRRYEPVFKAINEAALRTDRSPS